MVAQARSDPTKQQKDAYNIFSSMASKPIDICWIETGSQSELLVLWAQALGHSIDVNQTISPNLLRIISCLSLSITVIVLKEGILKN